MSDIAFSVIVNNNGIDDIVFKTIMLKGDKGNSVDHVEKTSTSGLVDTYTIYLTDGTIGGTFTVTNGNDINIDDTAVSYSKTWSSQKIKDEMDAFESSINADVAELSSLIPQTATIEDVAIASFNDGADDVPLSELIVDIEAWQEGSGEPSPDNERAIHGWTECNLTKAGVNLFNGEIRNGYYNSSTGAFSPNTNMIANVTPIKVIGGSNIYIASATYNIGITEYDSNMNFIRQSGGKKDEVYTLTPTTAYINFSNTWNSGSTYNDDIAINYPATETDYHAFEGETATIDFDGNTVYKAKLNVLTGLMTILGADVDLGSLSWINYGNTPNYDRYISTSLDSLAKTNANVLCSALNNVWNTVNSIWIGGGNGRLSATSPVGAYSDATAFKNAVTGYKLVYELATPIEIQLTPVEVRTLLKNNISADTGNVDKIVYFKTGSEAVARMIEAYMRAQPET